MHSSACCCRVVCLKQSEICVYYFGGYHPVNESFIRSPPPGVRIKTNVKLQAFNDFGKPKEFTKSWRRRKELGKIIVDTLGIPRMMPIVGRFDLIHTNSAVIPLSTTPWIGNLENPSAFFGFNEKWLGNPRMKRRLARHLLSKRCRGIHPYTNTSRDYLFRSLDDWEEELRGKTQVIYPAIDDYLIEECSRRAAAKPRDDTVRFLFVGDRFIDKGGREILRAFQHIRDSTKTELTLVTSAPQHHSNEFAEYRRILNREKGVKFYETGIRRRTLLELYAQADVFLFPSYMDQVPFVLLEAMAAKLPIVGSNCYAIPEMVLDGENGFIVKSPWTAFPADGLRTEKHLGEYMRAVLEPRNFDSVVDELIDKMAKLCADDRLRQRFGQKSLELVKDGKFSVATRNRQLAESYRRAVAKT